jgi:replicative DNA helicase
LPFLILDGAGMTPQQVGSVCPRLADRHKLDVLALDYIQLLRASTHTRREDAGIVSQTLKSLAVSRGMLTIGLSQMRRAPAEQRAKQPRLDDLKESGDLEADADVVIILHREPPAEGKPDLMRLAVAKNRTGPTFRTRAVWVGRYTSMEEATDGRGEPPDASGARVPDELFADGEATGKALGRDATVASQVWASGIELSEPREREPGEEG